MGNERSLTLIAKPILYIICVSVDGGVINKRLIKLILYSITWPKKGIGEKVVRNVCTHM